jgi:carbonic anhydrase
LEGLLPDDYQHAGYYTYTGSLTTPPCTEGIEFYILKTPIKFSAAELEEFARRYPSPNARDIQELNGRPVRNR